MFSTGIGSNGTQSSINLKIDLIRDSIQAVAFPGQNVHALLSFAISRGIADSELESQVIPAIQGGQNLGAVSIINASLAQGIPLVVINASTLSQLDSLNLTADAKARITTDVQAGVTVIVPASSITVNGQATTSWFEVNPSPARPSRSRRTEVIRI